MFPQVVTTALIQRVPPPPLRLTPQSLGTPRGQTALQEMLCALTRTKVKAAMERPRSPHMEISVSRKRRAQRARLELKRPGWPPTQARCIPRPNLRM